jgi:predicted permease
MRRLQPQIRDAGAPQAVAYPDVDILKSPLTLIPGASGTSALRRRYAQPLSILVGLVALVLIIACANLAAVMLARAASRRHDLSVQRALGASGSRLAYHLLVECLVLSGLGTLVGLVVARWGAAWLTARLSTPVTPVVLDLSGDWRVVTFTAIVSLLTTFSFGVAPAIRAARVDPVDALREHGQIQRAGPWGAVLIAGQVSLSLLLVVTAGLFVRSFARLTTTPTGFDTDRVLLVNVNTTHANLERTQRLPLFMRAIEATRAIPGVSAVGGSSMTPFDGIAVIDFVTVTGSSVRPEAERAVATNVISPGWLAAYGMQLEEGRDFDASDVAGARPVAIVNHAFVRRFFAVGSALGRTFSGVNGGTTTVIGIVSDAVYNSLKEPAPPTAYFHLGAAPVSLTFSVHVGSGSAAHVASAVAKSLSTLNPDLAFSFRTLDDQVWATLNQDRVLAMLSGFFGALALLLAGLGVYGVTADAVTRRRTEIGIRMALGATPADVMRVTLLRVGAVVGAGLAIGLLISAWASQFVRTLVFGLEPRDATTLLGSVVVLLIVGLTAGAIPAWRAARVDPAEVLRYA